MLNRNFPDYFAETDDSPQPETIAIMKWMKKIPFVLSADIHSGGMFAMYPFNNYSKLYQPTLPYCYFLKVL